MRPRLFLLSAFALVLALTPTSLTSNAATSNIEIQAITDAQAGAVDLTFNSKFAKTSVISYQITAKPNSIGAASYSKTFTRKVSGYLSHRVTPLTPGTNYKFTVTIITTNKKVFKSADFSFYTASTKPNIPVITKAVEVDADEAVVYFDAPSNDGQTPVLYYTATAFPGGATGITLQQGSGSITITGLTKSTSYTFTVTAHNINGSSLASKPSAPITTLATKIIRITPVSSGGSTLAAPAFTLSSAAETKTVGILSTGYSITSTGGTIASYSISPALPAGLTFSTSNGLITGRSTETRTATTHTITATNASGSASNTYRLRVNGDIGDIGPGGGRIFYYLAAGFSCGASFTDTGSPTGEKCKYLEVAPSGWNSGSDPAKLWAVASKNNVEIPGVTKSADTEAALFIDSGIGVGYKDSIAIVNYGNDTTTAAGAVRAYSGGSQSDWYLGSPVELNILCQWARGVPSSITTGCTGGALNSSTYGASDAGFSSNSYWSSTQADGFPLYAYVAKFQTSGKQSVQKSQNFPQVRPIRAF